MKKFLFTLVFLGLVGFGVWKMTTKESPADPASSPSSSGTSSTSSSAGTGSALAELEGRTPTETEVRTLAPAALYQMKDNVFDLELSEYAGYAGLIVANGGLDPSENSVFFKNHGFKVRIKLSEEESWDKLNSGGIGGSATTVDVLAVFAKSFQGVVPAQIGFSRGADAVVVTSDIKRVNHLKGKVLITSQFTEADFFIRYLASEAGLEVKALVDDEQPEPDRVNLIYATDAFEAGDIFAREVAAGRTDLAGAVVWGSKIDDVLEATPGKTRLLVDNRNLLVVADVLVVNKLFAQANPKIVEGLTEGLLVGNDMVRNNPDAHLDVIQRAFKWKSREETRAELAKVHFSNHPENRAFFSGAIDAAGSYGGIFQSTMFSYGAMVDHSVPPDRLLALALEPLASKFAQQQISIQPIRSATTRSVEGDPLLTRDIRFYFEPNSSILGASADNDKYYESIRKLLQVSPGSRILLRGHVDTSRVEEYRKDGPEAFRRRQMEAVALSKQRADAVKAEIVRRFQLPAERFETVGRGWEDPAGADQAANRRVEVQWLTVE